jgi:hypothetical protein
MGRGGRGGGRREVDTPQPNTIKYIKAQLMKTASAAFIHEANILFIRMLSSTLS